MSKMDLVELDLQAEALKAHYQYISYLSKKYSDAFTKRLLELETPFYRYPLPPVPDLGKGSLEFCQKYYNQLNSKYPDVELFQILLENRNEHSLRRLVESTQIEATLRLLLIEDIQERISEAKNSYCWQWACGTKETQVLIESLFMKDNPVREMNTKIQASIDRLRSEKILVEAELKKVQNEASDIRADIARMKAKKKKKVIGRINANSGNDGF
jgi:hypothetical protein